MGLSTSIRPGQMAGAYAVDGEVEIDTSPVASSPGATIAKARRVHRAALALANPSAQDRAAVATAQRMEQEASQELPRKKAKKKGIVGALPHRGRYT